MRSDGLITVKIHGSIRQLTKLFLILNQPRALLAATIVYVLKTFLNPERDLTTIAMVTHGKRYIEKRTTRRGFNSIFTLVKFKNLLI
jgi:hypothetical protein